MPRKRKSQQIDLAEYGDQWEGWVLNRNGLFSPEGEKFDTQRLRWFHWQSQLYSALRERLSKPEQYPLF
ncbi:MAG: DUF3653 domain-containing protein [Sedimenticola sp.]